MRLVTYLRNDVHRVGAVADGRVYDLIDCLRASEKGDPLTAATIPRFLAAGPGANDSAQEAIAWAQARGGRQFVSPIEEVRLQAPIPRPGKLLCLAGNYADHILEGGGTFPGKEKMIPRFFSKPSSAIVGPGEAIRIPSSTTWVDWELELAVVIGRGGRDLPAERARAHIGGYTILIDVSARELAFRGDLPMQPGDEFFDWLVGKWLDTFGPMGPWVTTADQVLRPDRLGMKLWVNDELQQDGNTGQMIFSPAEAIAFISQFVTLQPGDIISTGTPAGVGLARNIGLKPGDRIRGTIDGLGTLENPVEAL
jgi:2-keto-4-pentenoate hydratase/2-oxohepta-3-ene-1,7-dioic acid hydratase in catechol pathway